MSSLTENDIQTAVKKHVNFAILLALVPIIFIQFVIYFSGEEQLNVLLVFITPVAAVSACAHFIKSVLIELSISRVSNT